MSITEYNNQTRRVVGLLLIGMLLLSGCKHSSSDSTANTKAPIPDFGQPVRVSSGGVHAAEPATAASPDGSVYVAWINHGLKSEADVMIARFTGDGQMQGPPARVNWAAGTVAAWRGDPPTVAVAPDNTVFVGWTGRLETESGVSTDLFLSSSRDHGATFSAPVRVNDDTKPALHGMHSLAIGNDGRIYVAWLDERNITPMKDMKMDAKTAGHHMESNRELFVSSSSDGGHTFAPNRQVATDVCPCCKTALAIGPEGRVYLSWRQVLPGDFRHIAVASSTDGGVNFSKAVIVSDDQWVLRGCPVSGASLSAATDGTLRVLWYAAGEKGEHGIYWSESRDSGQSFSPRQLLAATSARGTPVLLNDQVGSAMGVWEASESGAPQLFVARLSGDDRAGNHQHIAGNGELPAATATTKRLFIVSLKKEGEKQSVWLASGPKGVVQP
jgi:hypothetical protein